VEHLVTNDGCTTKGGIDGNLNQLKYLLQLQSVLETYNWDANETIHSGTYLVTNDGCTARKLVLTVTLNQLKYLLQLQSVLEELIVRCKKN
jgi:hypothetical protein